MLAMIIFGALCARCLRHDTVHKLLRQLHILYLDLLSEALRLARIVLDSGRLLKRALLREWLDSRDIAAIREDLGAATF